jgi:hypothetical protein
VSAWKRLRAVAVAVSRRPFDAVARIAVASSWMPKLSSL